MGIYPDPFWDLSWGEFDVYVSGWDKNREDDWRHTREVLAAIKMNARSQEAQRAGRKSYQTIRGKDIIPLSGDVISKKILNASEELIAFKKSCKRLGIAFKRLGNKKQKNG